MLQQCEAERDIPILVQVGTERLTPIFGTAQPATGGTASGLLIRLRRRRRGRC